MSAICGAIDGALRALDPTVLDPAMAVLRTFPGESAEQTRLDALAAPHVALGHRLRSRSRAPSSGLLVDTGAGLALTADVRLDNREALAEALGLDAVHRDALSDEALLLHAWARWGPDTPERLLGDFAFAVYDHPRETLFCVRDPFGIRPLYHSTVGGRFCFASDIEAMLAMPHVTRTLHLPSVRALLEAHPPFSPRARTPWRDIEKLPPAHIMAVKRGEARSRRHWSPPLDDAPASPRDEAEWVERGRAVLTEAVACRARTHAPVGAHISGGLDSSAISVLAWRHARANGGAFEAFSWSPAPTGAEGEEQERIETLRRLEGFDVHYTDLRAEDLVGLYTTDWLTMPLNTLDHEATASRIAIDQGCRTILSGWGGDDLLSYFGQGWYAELLMQGRPLAAMRELRAMGQRYEPDIPLWRLAVRRLLLTQLPLSLRRRLFEPAPTPPEGLQPALERALRAAPALVGPVYYEVGTVRQMQHNLLEAGHLTARTESWAAWGLRRGLDYAFPLLDRRVAELALQVPAGLFTRDGWKRHYFRRVCEGILPADMRWHWRKDDPSLFAHRRSLHPEVGVRVREVLLSRGNRDLVVPEVLAALLDAAARPPRAGEVRARPYRERLRAMALAWAPPGTTW